MACLRRPLPAALACLVLVHAVHAAQVGPAMAATQTLTHGGVEFLAGELEGLAVDALGQLVAAPVARTDYETTSLYAWSLALDARDRLVVGSGDDGRIYRMKGDKLEEWVDTIAYEILALLPFEGAVLAGSSPDGVIYRVEDDGTHRIALSVPQQSVWSLAPGSRAGTWLAGSGPGAHLTRAGKGAEAGEVLHRLPATNLTELLRDAAGLWLGTSGPGLVFRIEGDDDKAPRLVYEAPQGEIAALLTDDAGGVFALSVNAVEGDKASSRVVRLGSAGELDVIWEGTEVLISLARHGDGGFLAGEARTGRVVRIDLEGRLSLWSELEGGDPLALLVQGERTWVATGNLGVVHALAPGRRDEGTWTSTVLNAPRVERWGRLWTDGWGDDVQVSTRSGVRARPDATWSDWSDFAPVGSTIAAPVAPYLQYRLRLRDSTVSTVHLAWAERNAAPRVRYVRIEPAGGAMLGSGGGANSALRQRFDSGLEVEYSIGSGARPSEPEQSAWVRGIRTVHWEGVDPNADSLSYDIAVRRLPDGEWYTLAEAHTERVLAWDTSAVADGTYRVRVIASDAAQHPANAGRTGMLESAPVHVDNTPPVIQRVEVGAERLRVRARDASSPIAQAHWRNEGGEWIPFAPVDGVLDAAEEVLELPTALTEGKRVWIRVVDRAGNVALHEHRVER